MGMMRSHSLRRGLAGALALLYVALTIGTALHAGPHLDPEIAWLPIDLHHHAYGFAVASPDPPQGIDLCVACQISRLVPRLPAPSAALPALASPVASALPADLADPRSSDLDLLGPRAPPIA